MGREIVTDISVECHKVRDPEAVEDREQQQRVFGRLSERFSLFDQHPCLLRSRLGFKRSLPFEMEKRGYERDLKFDLFATQRGSGRQGRNLVEGMGNLRGCFYQSRTGQRPLSSFAPQACGSPIRDTLSEGFSYFVTSIAAPVASGRSVRRVGLAPTGKRRLFTAHTHNRHQLCIAAFETMLIFARGEEQSRSSSTVAKCQASALTDLRQFDILPRTPGERPGRISDSKSSATRSLVHNGSDAVL
jgi:hypothetical protein